MEITLIKAIKGNEVHGADSAKKTGCGINLTKPENISRYITNGVISDISEAMDIITCEKCKQVLAKRSIKADRKEMKTLIKEERARAKRGIEDENIVPLGGSQKQGYLPDTGSRRPAPYQPAKPSKPVVTGAAPVSPMYNPNGSNPYGSAPASNPPVQQSAPKPAENDIMSQFAIPKQNTAPAPQSTAPKPVAAQNDVMSQFAIPSPVNTQNTEQPVKKAPVDLNSAFSQFAVPSNKPVDTIVPEAPKNVASNIDDALAQFAIPSPQQNTAPVQPEPVQTNANPYGIDDALAQFAIPNPQPNADVEILGNEPEEHNTYANEDIVDIEPVSDTVEPYAQPVEEKPEETNWDTVANHVFGDDEAVAAEADKLIDEFMSAPDVTDTDSNTVEASAVTEAPAMNDISSSDANQYSSPYGSDAQPVKQETNDNLHRYTPPVFPDEPLMSTPVAPMVPPIVPMSAPNVAPMPEMPAQQPAQFANQSVVGYDTNGQPLYGFVQQQLVGYDPSGQPLFAPVQQPVNQTPVQPVVPPVAPMPQAPVQPVVPPVAPMTQAPVFNQPQQVNISQIGLEKAQHIMPNAVASAVAKSKEMQKTNIFDMQGIQMPVLDSIEDALSQMGEKVKTKQEVVDSSTSMPFFEEYKVPPKMAAYAPAPKFNQSNNNTQQRMLSKSEMKNLKKQEKIDAKFKKELAKRGF